MTSVRTFWRRTENVRNGLIVALLALALAIILVQSFQARDSAAQAKTSAAAAVTAQKSLAQAVKRNHAKSTAQNAEITGLLKEHSTDFAQQQATSKAASAYDADVLAFAETIQAELAALCVNHIPACPPLPPVPGS